jgi:hypothetical protein
MAQARAAKIAAATHAARKLAVQGLHRGVILKDEATDPTDLLRGAGLASAIWDTVTGEVTAHWTLDVADASTLERHLATLTATAVAFQRFEELSLLWPAFGKALASPGQDGQLMLKLTQLDRAADRLTDGRIAELLDDMGYALVRVTRDKGEYYESGSGFGGTWRRHPSIQVVCTPVV